MPVMQDIIYYALDWSPGLMGGIFITIAQRRGIPSPKKWYLLAILTLVAAIVRVAALRVLGYE